MKIIGKFLKQVKIGYFAVVHLDIEQSEKTIIEIGQVKYESKFSQGDIIVLPCSNANFEDWIEGVIKGIKYALEKTENNYHIKIEKIEGLLTATNPLIISVATIFGVWDFLNYLPIDAEIEKINNWAFESWTTFKYCNPNELVSVK